MTTRRGHGPQSILDDWAASLEARKAELRRHAPAAPRPQPAAGGSLRGGGSRKIASWRGGTSSSEDEGRVVVHGGGRTESDDGRSSPPVDDRPRGHNLSRGEKPRQSLGEEELFPPTVRRRGGPLTGPSVASSPEKGGQAPGTTLQTEDFFLNATRIHDEEDHDVDASTLRQRNEKPTSAFWPSNGARPKGAVVVQCQPVPLKAAAEHCSFRENKAPVERSQRKASPVRSQKLWHKADGRRRERRGTRNEEGGTNEERQSRRGRRSGEVGGANEERRRSERGTPTSRNRSFRENAAPVEGSQRKASQGRLSSRSEDSRKQRKASPVRSEDSRSRHDRSRRHARSVAGPVATGRFQPAAPAAPQPSDHFMKNLAKRRRKMSHHGGKKPVDFVLRHKVCSPSGKEWRKNRSCDENDSRWSQKLWHKAARWEVGREADVPRREADVPRSLLRRGEVGGANEERQSRDRSRNRSARENELFSRDGDKRADYEDVYAHSSSRHVCEASARHATAAPDTLRGLRETRDSKRLCETPRDTRRPSNGESSSRSGGDCESSSRSGGEDDSPLRGAAGAARETAAVRVDTREGQRLYARHSSRRRAGQQRFCNRSSSEEDRSWSEEDRHEDSRKRSRRSRSSRDKRRAKTGRCSLQEEGGGQRCEDEYNVPLRGAAAARETAAVSDSSSRMRGGQQRSCNRSCNRSACEEGRSSSEEDHSSSEDDRHERSREGEKNRLARGQILDLLLVDSRGNNARECESSSRSRNRSSSEDEDRPRNLSSSKDEDRDEEHRNRNRSPSKDEDRDEEHHERNRSVREKKLFSHCSRSRNRSRSGSSAQQRRSPRESGCANGVLGGLDRRSSRGAAPRSGPVGSYAPPEGPLARRYRQRQDSSCGGGARREAGHHSSPPGKIRRRREVEHNSSPPGKIRSSVDIEGSRPDSADQQLPPLDRPSRGVGRAKQHNGTAHVRGRGAAAQGMFSVRGRGAAAQGMFPPLHGRAEVLR